MKKGLYSAVIIFSVFLCARTFAETATSDINQDGQPDITYYHDGKYVNKAEADIDYDGKTEVTVHAKDGRFQSAEADMDHDGKPDKEFTDPKAFNKWLNENGPDFSDKMGTDDWMYYGIKF